VFDHNGNLITNQAVVYVGKNSLDEQSFPSQFYGRFAGVTSGSFLQATDDSNNGANLFRVVQSGGSTGDIRVPSGLFTSMLNRNKWPTKLVANPDSTA